MLLDTHALLWWFFDDARLSQRARGAIADPQNTIYVSSASGWEIATKYRLGKLPSAAPLVRDMTGWLRKASLTELPITLEHAQRAGLWSQPHRDPFDRMLAAQSVIENLGLVSIDNALPAFGIDIFR